jgi:hypothetical protein
MTYFEVKCLIFLKRYSFFFVLSLFYSLLLGSMMTACQNHDSFSDQLILEDLAIDQNTSIDLRSDLSHDFQHSNDQSPNDQSPNDQSPNDQSPNDQSPNDQSPNDQSLNDQSLNDQSPNDQDVMLFDLDLPDASVMINVLYQETKEIQQTSRSLQDLDHDGLDDGWENLFNDSRMLSNLQDSDQNGTIDGDEDFDGDGLLAKQEAALAFSQSPINLFETLPPHPFAKDLLIELDYMMGKSLNLQVYQLLFDIWQSPPFDSIGGIRLHIYEDQMLPPILLDGSFSQRNQLFLSNPPMSFDPNFPSHQLIHVIVATKRLDDMSRAGEVVTAQGNLEASGLLLYYDLLDEIHPRCGINTPPPVPFITFDEALAGTFAHELGHILQLGHDTQINGENPWNLMAVTSGCTSSRQRFHGEGNDDPSLGSTQSIQRSRFSRQASELMRFTEKLSVETDTLINQGLGLEH